MRFSLWLSHGEIGSFVDQASNISRSLGEIVTPSLAVVRSCILYFG